MDKVKQALEFVKQYHFWILTGLALIVSSIGYVMARMSLTDQISKRTSVLDQKYTLVTSLDAASRQHPNSISKAEMDKIIDALTKDVQVAWEKQYQKQVEIFTWPANALQPRALEKVKNFRPIELSLEFPMPPEKDPLDASDREIYRDYIATEFPKIAQIIGSKWKAKLAVIGSGGYGSAMMSSMPGGSSNFQPTPPSGGGSFYAGGGNPSAAPVESDELVIWPSESQQELINAMCYWFSPKDAPSTLQICYTQEDIWVLQALLRIIAKTNGDARENFQAAIKEIEFIRIGFQAMGKAGEISGGSAASSYMGSMMPGMSPTGSGGMPAGYGQAAMGGGSSDKTKASLFDPADNRYVDAKFNPVSGKDLRSKMKDSSPESAFFAVAKRIPVRMRFSRMDQRKINDLLTECGNSNLVLEVRQVRVNTAAAPAPGAMAGGPAGGGAERPQMAGGGSAGASLEGGESFMQSSSSSSSGGGPSVAASSFDLPVEIYGVIYLYNPVDINKLGLQNVTMNTQLVTSVQIQETESTSESTDSSQDNDDDGGETTTPRAPQGSQDSELDDN